MRRSRTPEEAEELLHQLVEYSPGFVWMLSPDLSEVLYIDDTYEEIWGRSVEAVLDDMTDFLKGVHPDDRETAHETMARLAEGTSTEVELRVNAQEDYRRHVQIYGEPIYDGGEVVAVAGFVGEITERVERERELEQAVSRYSALLENSNDAICRIEYDGDTPIIREANPEFESLFVPPDTDVVGRDLDEVVAGAQRRDEAREISSRVRNGEIVSDELKRDTVEGPKDFHWQAVPISRTDSGQPESAFVIYTDISELIAREQALERQNQRLDDFAHAISHDLRNPLNVAQGRLELAREGVNNEHLDAIERAHDRMQNLIDDVLALAREDEVISDFQAVSLGEVTEESWANVETNEASLDVESTRTVQADERRLRQLLENLIRDAVEHGGENVTVCVGDMEGGFTVEDDGAGVPEADREQIFKPGYSTSNNGTGFGLSIVDQVVEAHGWDIHVSESDAGGARFEITGVETVA